MGEVYRAQDSNLKRIVAIKVLPDALAAEPDRISRFEREAQLLASLNHPNIAVVHDFQQDGPASAGDGTGGGRDARRSPAARARRDRRCAPHRASDRRGAGGRSRERDHSSGSQARQHQGRRRRKGESPGLRPGQDLRGHADRIRCHQFTDADRRHDARHHPRDSRLHEPGAGARWTRRPANRHLGTGLRDLRDVDRHAGVCRRESLGHRRIRSSQRAGLAGAPGRDSLPDPRPAQTLPAEGLAATSPRRGRRTHRNRRSRRRCDSCQRLRRVAPAIIA